MNNIEILNNISKTKREDLPFENNFNINELSQMPELFDWVNCDVGVENKFHMFLGGKDDGVALRFFWNGSYEKYTLKTTTNFSGWFARPLEERVRLLSVQNQSQKCENGDS